MGLLDPAEAKIWSLLMLAYFPWFFGNRKKRLAALFELFKSTEYFETEGVTYNHKKKGKKENQKQMQKNSYLL